MPKTKKSRIYALLTTFIVMFSCISSLPISAVQTECSAAYYDTAFPDVTKLSPKSTNARSIPYSKLKKYNYLTITFKPYSKSKCGHGNFHGSESGNVYDTGGNYCPWATVFIGGITTSGKNTMKDMGYYDLYNPKDTESSVTYTIKLSSILSMIGSDNIKTLFFVPCFAKITAIKGTTTLPDFTLGTGSFSKGKITEQIHYSYYGNNKSTGEPEPRQPIVVLNQNDMSLKGYNAIKINYTMKNPGKAKGVVVGLLSVDWAGRMTLAEKYFAPEKNGSIVFDLSGYQDMTIDKIYVGPVAKDSAKIGDTFAPGFTIKSAKLTASNSEKATPEIKGPSQPTVPISAY